MVDFLYGILAADPYRVGKPLRFELEGYWSARRGRYHVIYSVHEDQVLVRVLRISHRADVYGWRNFARAGSSGAGREASA
ncbi:type II toxin-antitoxin system RelE family toxin [Blastococcus atacamensis]|uniref:type II toxin-antitoxin system RelE family toxin n=1 Tax=Blastococcus atacamensis TaxID=2070508 RepID=UPI000CEBAB32|nr:type II toxin-antitoxin system RelE/ParE family toxin [Blastococcus atacamensis]